VLADGLIGQPGIKGGHERRVVVEYFLHDMLGNVAVETGREQYSNHAEYPSRSGQPEGLFPVFVIAVAG